MANDPKDVEYERKIELSEETRSLDSFYVSKPEPAPPPAMQEGPAEGGAGSVTVADFDG